MDVYAGMCYWCDQQNLLNCFLGHQWIIPFSLLLPWTYQDMHNLKMHFKMIIKIQVSCYNFSFNYNVNLINLITYAWKIIYRISWNLRKERTWNKNHDDQKKQWIRYPCFSSTIFNVEQNSKGEVDLIILMEIKLLCRKLTFWSKLNVSRRLKRITILLFYPYIWFGNQCFKIWTNWA